MPKNNRVKITQNKTCSFKLDKLKYIETESKRLNKSTAQIIDEAIQLHIDMTKLEADNVKTGERPEREGV